MSPPETSSKAPSIAKGRGFGPPPRSRPGGPSPGLDRGAGSNEAGKPRRLGKSAPTGLTEEGAREEAGGGKAAAARGHGGGGRGGDEGCGHPPMTLLGPLESGRGRGARRKRVARAFAGITFSLQRPLYITLRLRRWRRNSHPNADVYNNSAFLWKRGFDSILIVTAAQGKPH